jgi:hypothetical protein
MGGWMNGQLIKSSYMAKNELQACHLNVSFKVQKNQNDNNNKIITITQMITYPNDNISK